MGGGGGETITIKKVNPWKLKTEPNRIWVEKMSSEIEVVEEVQSIHKENGESSSKPIEDESLKNDVYTAAAYGDLEKLHRLVECEGCSVSEPDGLGYYALQWSALNNRSAVAQYIIEVTTKV